MPPMQESATSVLLCKSMREARVSRHDAFGKLSQTDELLIKIISTALRGFFFCLDYKEGQICCKRQHKLIPERQGGELQKPRQLWHGSLWQNKRPRCRFSLFFDLVALFNSAHHSFFYRSSINAGYKKKIQNI